VNARASLIAWPIVALACNPLPPCDDVARKPVAQGATVSFTGDVGSGPYTIESARIVDAEVLVTACEDDGSCGELRFAIDAQAAPSLPVLGAEMRADQANCFGEGCSDTQWTVDDAFEVGTSALLDDDVSTLRPFDTHIAPGSFDEDRACADGDNTITVGSVAIRADGGDVVLSTGDARAVTIDGTPWFAFAGIAVREGFTQSDRCADCPDPGDHSISRATAVLYRTVE
jgi:hypothetical protein